MFSKHFLCTQKESIRLYAVNSETCIIYNRHVKLKPMCGPHFHIQRRKKISAGHSFKKFSKFYCSEALLYENLSKN